MTKQHFDLISTTAAAAVTDHLLTEWLATPSINSRQSGRLEALGVTRETIHRCGGLAWARVSTTGRLYAPRRAGVVSLIQPVWAGPAPSIHQGVERPKLADLIAWRPEEPTIWHYRQGTPGAVLGADKLDLAHAEGWPICFALTPLDWLRGGCRGAVLLEVCEAHWRTEDEADKATTTTKWWHGDAA